MMTHRNRNYRALGSIGTNPKISISFTREVFAELASRAADERRPFAAIVRDLVHDALAARGETAQSLSPQTKQGGRVMAAFREMGDAALLAEFARWDCKVQTATGWGAALMQAAKWRDACGRILTERGLMQDFAPCIRRDPHSSPQGDRQ